MKKIAVMFLSFFILVSWCISGFAASSKAHDEQGWFANSFESAADLSDAKINLAGNTFETPGVADTAGAMNMQFRADRKNYQPSIGLKNLMFTPGREYVLSTWIKFNNAEVIKAPKLRFMLFYTRRDNPDMLVYKDAALSEIYTDRFETAAMIDMSPEDAGLVSADGTCTPGWHKVSIPFTPQSQMLWNAYMDESKMAEYKAQILFRFGAVSDAVNDPRNFTEDYVSSINAEADTPEYYNSLYMDISFDDLTIEPKEPEEKPPFGIQNVTSSAEGALFMGQTITIHSDVAGSGLVKTVVTRICQEKDGKKAAVCTLNGLPGEAVRLSVPDCAFGSELSAEVMAISEDGAVSQKETLVLGTVEYGAAASLLKKGDSVEWSVTGKSTSGQFGMGTAILASYDAADRLVAVACSNVELSGTATHATVPEDNTAVMKLFLWRGKDLTSMQPLCREQEVVVNPFAGKDKINIVYFGGSITEGVGASEREETCYRALVGKYFKEAYPDIEVNNVHQGVGGTGSDYGLIRLSRDVISYSPDLVFIEFAVNDNGRDSRLEMESIVRTLGSLEKAPYIVYLYTTRSSFADVKPYHVQVGDYYGIPQIDLQQELKEQIAATGNPVSYYLPDSVHPSDAGHAVYANKIISCMESGMYYKKPHVTENKLVAASGETKINAVAAKDAHLTGTWSTATGNFNRPCILSGQAGDMAEFTFTGNFFGLESGLNDDGGKYEVYVDGELFHQDHCYYANIHYNHCRFGCASFTLENTEHTVTVKVLGEKGNDAASGTKVCLFNLFYGEIKR
ncbi:SGNH/GDSL hydrolase family protein [Congzhengia sp.]|uniref:SGNH/GDSL hydrolase family protein n=1 Tax=Congzhengia sp. TaxID=2944168 RepID=UPI0030772DF4